MQRITFQISKLLSISCLLCCLLSACSSQNTDKHLVDYLSNYKDILGQKIRLTDSLINTNKNNKINPTKAQFTILIVISTDCGNCIKLIDEWKDFNEKYHFKNTRIVFVALGQNNDAFQYYIDNGRLNDFSILLDTSGNFLYKNNITNYYQRPLLLNSEGKVIMVGNPIDNEIINKYYDEQINSK